MAMNQVPGENIYIGGFLSLKNKAALTRANITHIVSVLRLQPSEDLFAPYKHLAIEVDDVDDENILEHFPRAIAFIQSGLDEGGSVLIHCAMGKSRSATICIAFLLHRDRHTTNPEAALALIREGRPLCEPNEGFMQQLTLYHQMGCPDDVSGHPIYQRWLYHREVEESVACGRAPELDAIRFEDEQPVSTESYCGQTTEIKCRKCRRMLATTPFIIPHEKPSQKKSRGAVEPECAHIFLHALTWMRPSLFPSTPPADHSDSIQQAEDAPLSGRLTCPNPSCGSNIGKFAWQGMQCSCGKWIVPAMGVARARVDVLERKSPKGNATPNARLGAMGIRLPPGMRSFDAGAPGTGRNNL
ncbi:hypothetical protein DTO212C5_2909 [Paecilomyces variotii]|nr:hypothetical protein DTO212C5_2909 [Paecilomyces variotii]